MLAVVSLTATLGAPGRSRVPDLVVSPFALAMSAAVAIGFLGVGAVLCWSGMYVGGSWRPLRDVGVASALLVAILFQPVFAVMVALGLRSKS